MKTKVLIVEDELPSARKLSAFISHLRPDYEVVTTLQSVKEAVHFFQSDSVDLIFLDIHLADGNSFEIFEHVKVDTPIIFTTAFDQYAISAFDQNSIGYLLKPISKDALEAAILKFEGLRKDVAVATTGLDYKVLGEIIAQQKSPEYQERFMVFYKDKIKTVRVDEIAYFYASSKAVFMTLHNGRTYDISFTLEHLEAKLNPKDFFRANRKFIVHIKAVKDAILYSKSKLKLNLLPEPDAEVIISSQKSADFKRWLSK